MGLRRVPLSLSHSLPLQTPQGDRCFFAQSQGVFNYLPFLLALFERIGLASVCRQWVNLTFFGYHRVLVQKCVILNLLWVRLALCAARSRLSLAAPLYRNCLDIDQDLSRLLSSFKFEFKFLRTFAVFSNFVFVFVLILENQAPDLSVHQENHSPV